MVRSRRQSRRQRSSRRRGGFGGSPVDGSVTEVVTISFTVGATQPVTRAVLSSVPGSRAFRISRVEAEMVGYLPGSSSTSPPSVGSPAACAAQLRIMTPNHGASSRSDATSGAHMLGVLPRRIVVVTHPQSDWWPMETALSEVVIAVDGICVSTTSARVSGLLHIRIALGVEQTSEACPALTHVGDLEHHDDDPPDLGDAGGAFVTL